MPFKFIFERHLKMNKSITQVPVLFTVYKTDVKP